MLLVLLSKLCGQLNAFPRGREGRTNADGIAHAKSCPNFREPSNVTCVGSSISSARARSYSFIPSLRGPLRRPTPAHRMTLPFTRFFSAKDVAEEEGIVS